MIQVDIWSDIACPWCYIGKRNFETALSGWEHRADVAVTWHSFELDPHAPAERVGDLTERLADKYGVSIEQARATQARITALAADAGLDLHFETARSGNTFDGHRLVHLAAAHGKQDAMTERLFSAYFSEGELIADHETLARLAGSVGLPAAEVGGTLGSDRYADDVRLDESTAHALGITAVPFFVVDRAYGASGAQPPAVLASLLDKACSERRPVRGAGVS